MKNVHVDLPMPLPLRYVSQGCFVEDGGGSDVAGWGVIINYTMTFTLTCARDAKNPTMTICRRR